MAKIKHLEIDGTSANYWALLGLLGVFILGGLGSMWFMEHNGHWVTGMTNQIVWGVPHVMAVFLIVAASGALNVASIASVFNKTVYKPLAPLSAFLALALLAGGLAVLVLDLGRPDRLMVAMTHYNFKSIFAWNIYLYTGFFAVVGLYLLTMLGSALKPYGRLAGTLAFIWRLVLTTGTGSIFGFLVARQAYDAAIMAPMFIVFSLAYGLACFLLVLGASFAMTGRELGPFLVRRLRNLLGVFVAGSFYMTVVHHLTNLYSAERQGVEAFLLLDGGTITSLFWLGQVVVGYILPLALIYTPVYRDMPFAPYVAAGLTAAGGLAQMYVTIIGGQAYPLSLFPGMEASSSFFDGAINTYVPSLPESLLALSGIAIALAIVAVVVKLFRVLPVSLADETTDPHHGL
ncbi:MAG: molybdopterin oxidoreductase [Alphaproteobacteria bacterium RIFOXYD12_FULL_60_8]|nr:MAG: molybdopterin oxidoreductase [Alphaproteobacteria bacterium RIFOXYD12_FULL_60_8]